MGAERGNEVDFCECVTALMVIIGIVLKRELLCRFLACIPSCIHISTILYSHFKYFATGPLLFSIHI